jgi:hypothetical protein
MVMKKVTLTVVAIVALLLATPRAQADPVDGPSCGTWSVNADEEHIYHVSFYGGELGRVRIQGDGDTDLDLYVYDEFGNLIDYDTRYSDYGVVVWEPRWTGSFTIRVVNLGDVYNRYTIWFD